MSPFFTFGVMETEWLIIAFYKIALMPLNVKVSLNNIRREFRKTVEMSAH